VLRRPPPSALLGADASSAQLQRPHLGQPPQQLTETTQTTKKTMPPRHPNSPSAQRVSPTSDERMARAQKRTPPQRPTQHSSHGPSQRRPPPRTAPRVATPPPPPPARRSPARQPGHAPFPTPTQTATLRTRKTMPPPRPTAGPDDHFACHSRRRRPHPRVSPPQRQTPMVAPPLVRSKTRGASTSSPQAPFPVPPTHSLAGEAPPGRIPGLPTPRPAQPLCASSLLLPLLPHQGHWRLTNLNHSRGRPRQRHSQARASCTEAQLATRGPPLGA
jgi:hypothetical protein